MQTNREGALSGQPWGPLGAASPQSAPHQVALVHDTQAGGLFWRHVTQGSQGSQAPLPRG